MSRTWKLRLASAAALSALFAGVAAAATPISRGQTVRISGSGWAVIEFCTPRVSIALARSAPLRPLAIATVDLRTGPTDSGTFATTWRVPASVHGGLRTIVATQRCESGKNGAVHFVSRTTAVRVR
jgi:hypothetical protein